MSVCVCEYMCRYMCKYVCIIGTCDKISSNGISSKQLYMTCGYMSINNTIQKKIRSNVQRNLINSAGGKLEQLFQSIEIPETVALAIDW